MTFTDCHALSLNQHLVAIRYNEEGTTTSPFDMMLCNHTSRYHVAAAAVRAGAPFNPKVSLEAHEKASYIMHLAQKDRDYIFANGQGER